MITKFFTNVVVRFNPFGKEAKAARTILSQIPPSLAQQCTVDLKVLGKASKLAPLVEVTFKDKEVLKGDPRELTAADFEHMFDTHSRVLQFKEEISK